jgi:molecular chaperone GrpE
MVKKKTNSQEETKHDIQGEQAEYHADNKNKIHHENNKEEKEAQTDINNETADDAIIETAPPDKVVPEEKSPEEKLAEMQDKYLRLSAEFDNYRKRTLREKIELSKYAGENILLNILPLMDDFERAISHMTAGSDFTSMKEGIDLIYGKFVEFLKQNGVREVESLNCAFDVDLHDAVAKTPVVEDEKKGKIVDVVQKGYYLLDKVIRHSKVVVGE